MADYENRQEFELAKWPELRQMVNDLASLVYSERLINRQYKSELFTVASLCGESTHCQSHGAYGLHLMDVETERIQALYDYENSDMFTDAEKAGFDLMRAAAQSPNAVGPEHFAELRKHYSDEQIIEILAVNSLAGWLNQWNDSIGTVTDQESVDFAKINLAVVGWDIGKHAGEDHEQRAGHPRSIGWVKEQ